MEDESFEEALDRHLTAIRSRDLAAFESTIDHGQIVLITAEGEFMTDRTSFLERHRDWFAMPGWTVDAKLLHQRVAHDLATCVLELSYREQEDTPPQLSILSLVFARHNGRWLMVQDQNTPTRK